MRTNVDQTDNDPGVAKVRIRWNGGMSVKVRHHNVDNHLDILLFEGRDHDYDNQNDQEPGSVRDIENIRSCRPHGRFHRAYEKAASEDHTHRSVVDHSTQVYDMALTGRDEKKDNEEQGANHRNKVRVWHLTGDPIQGRRETRDEDALRAPSIRHVLM
jgi:hypothetical protein